jgi:hypothetical protein
MADAEGLLIHVDRLTIAPTGDDVVGRALLLDAHALGLDAVTAISTSSLVFLRGQLDDGHRSSLEGVLVDPLLDRGQWGSPERPAGSHVVRSYCTLE